MTSPRLRELTRRDLLQTATAAALVTPGPAAAQERVRIVGVLSNLPMNDPLMSLKATGNGYSRLPRLVSDLEKYGWVLGGNLRIEIRSSAGEPGARDVAVKELLALDPDVIITVSSRETAAMLAGTHTVPIVFATAADPVGSGLVQSLARPGGNATGFTNSDAEMGGKWIQFLAEAAPRISRIGVLLNPLTSPRGGRYFLGPLETTAAEMGLKLAAVHITDPLQIEAAVAAHAGSPPAGIVVPTDSFLVWHRRVLVEAVARYRVPTIYPLRYFMEVGGLMSYGPALEVRDAEYVNLILRGAKPAELPVQSPRRYELLINRKAAEALGLTLPLTLLARADQLLD